MKISYNWLKRYLDTTYSPEELSKILTDTGLEVEGLEKIEAIKGGLKGVVIGEIIACTPHDNADKLNVTTVDIGNGTPLQIVCGAPNVAAGQKVVVATVGTTLYPTPEKAFKIKKAKIRGIESKGMICAEDELGIGTSHDGIMVLSKDASIGTPAANYFQLEDDYQIEIGLTPNRSDAMGHIGVARDIVAYINVHDQSTTLNFPDVSSFKVDDTSSKVNVSVEAEDMAPRYMGLTISDITISPSPDWLKNALLAIGLTPINNVVDVTNFVLHELGTPLHAFDLSNVNGKIVVRKAKDKEIFTTLDKIERTLSSEDLMITNGDENMCLAGIFGGIHSGVKENTKAIFLEAAYFNPTSIRKSAKRHGLNTDASFRFERGIDPNLVPYALKRATLLIQEVAGGKVSMDPIDLYPSPIEKAKINFNYKRCNALIGQAIEKDTVRLILSSLEIEIIEENGEDAVLAIPTYRTDVTREADVIEEVLRIFGFNNINLPKKLNASLPNSINREIEQAQHSISSMLAAKGLSEIMNNSLTKSNYIEQFGKGHFSPENNVKMLNPLSQDLDVMRQSLVFQVLETIQYNQNRQYSDLMLFEFGKTYHKYSDSYTENKRLIIAITGRKTEEHWSTSNEKVSFYTIKGLVDAIFSRFGLQHLVQSKSLKKSILQDGIQLSITKRKAGEIGWVDSKLKRHFGIKNDVFIADINWDTVLECLKMNKVKFKELPKTFAVRRDFSLLLNDNIDFASIEEIARSSDKKLLKEVSLFDVYEGKKLPDGKKSYAVSFTFQDGEKTLKDEQVDAIMDKIHQQLTQQLDAELR